MVLSKLTIKLNATGNFPIAFHPHEQHDHSHHNDKSDNNTHKELIAGNLIVNPK